jgi:hypothetical protein
MEGLLHGMFGFFSVDDGVCCESDVAKLLFLQGVSWRLRFFRSACESLFLVGASDGLARRSFAPMDLRGDLLLRMCGENFCFPMSSSVVVLVGGGLVLAVADVCVVIAEGIILGDLDSDDGSQGDILCADVLIFCVLSCALGVYNGNGSVDFVTNDMVFGQRSLVGFFSYSFVYVVDDLAGVDLWNLVYQHEKPGWFSSPTASGGLPPTAWVVRCPVCRGCW